jgi:hypothetical protein
LREWDWRSMLRRYNGHGAQLGHAAADGWSDYAELGH